MNSRLLTAKQCALSLGIARSTFYTLTFFRQRTVYVKPRTPRWSEADVELYKALHSVERAA